VSSPWLKENTISQQRLIVHSPNGCPVRMAFFRTLRDGSSRIGKDRDGSMSVPVTVKRPLFKGAGELFSLDSRL
jgi:hypothetical protein